jgi:hypothetical protein
MNIYQARNLISILMESALYLSLPLEERSCLLSRLINNYPCLLDSGDRDRDEKVGVQHKSSGAGIFSDTSG